MSLIDRTISRLETRGWQQHETGGRLGPNCMLGALFIEDSLEVSPEYERTLNALKVVLRRQSGDPAVEHPSGLAVEVPSAADVIDWNDHPSRTIADVLDVLRLTKGELRGGGAKS